MPKRETRNAVIEFSLRVSLLWVTLGVLAALAIATLVGCGSASPAPARPASTVAGCANALLAEEEAVALGGAKPADLPPCDGLSTTQLATAVDDALPRYLAWDEARQQ
jgi:hypothetical protein